MTESTLEVVAREARELLDSLTVTVDQAEELAVAIETAADDDALRIAIHNLGVAVFEAIRDEFTEEAGLPVEPDPDFPEPPEEEGGQDGLPEPLPADEQSGLAT